SSAAEARTSASRSCSFSRLARAMPGTSSKVDRSTVRSVIGAVLLHVEDDDLPSAPVAVAAIVDVVVMPMLRDRPRAGAVAIPPRPPVVPMRRCDMDDRLSRPRPGFDGDRGGQTLTHAGCDH